MKRYVILGNGIAGQTCAEELRKLDPGASITMLAAEPHPLYSRVALPGFIRGQVREDKVMLRSRSDSKSTASMCILKRAASGLMSPKSWFIPIAVTRSNTTLS
jgi:NADPH-dependent 2,4-dienoyl-CoA reductase/sulfur reductase-like enzyme